MGLREGQVKERKKRGGREEGKGGREETRLSRYCSFLKANTDMAVFSEVQRL